MPWISKKKHAMMLEAVEKMQTALKESNDRLIGLQNNTFLVSIEREGRMNRFLFMRGGQTHLVQTMGLISDDIREWKKRLLQ